MFNLLDALVVISLVVGAYFGYRKGLGAMLLSLLGSITGMFAAYYFYQPLGLVLGKISPIKDGLSSMVTAKLPLTPELANLPLKDMPFDQLQKTFEAYNMPKSYEGMINQLFSTLRNAPQSEGINTLGGGLSYLVTQTILSLVALIIIYFVVSTAVRFLGQKTIGKHAPARLLSRIGGLALGFIFAAINTALLLVILIPVSSIAQGSQAGGLLSTLNYVIADSFIMNYVLRAAGSIVM